MPQDDATLSAGSAGSVRPFAWAVMTGDRVYDIYDNAGEAVAICLWLRDEENDGSWVTVPLYPHQPQPKLTDAEREAIEWFAEVRKPLTRLTQSHNREKYKDTLRGLLERTSHDAVPEAKAEESMKEPNGSSTGEPGGEPESTFRTGDTPSEAEIDALEYVVVHGHTASLSDYGILRQWLIRLRPEFDSAEDEDESDRPQPIANGPDADSRVWETPAKTNPTPPRNGTPEEGSVQGEGSVPDSRSESEPVAWWLKGTEYDTGCEYEYVSLVKESADAAAREGGTVTPLYRSPTLTEAERAAIKTAIGGFGMWVTENNLQSDESLRLALVTLRGLLERLQ